jgi:hypothetical protein
MRHRLTTLSAVLALAACSEQPREAATNTAGITVRAAEQNQLHQLNAINLAIALKRAIYGAGFRCKRVTDAGFIGPYQNLDMWMARCSEGRDWAIFAGPDGSAQVRDCKDLPGTEVPQCAIRKRPPGKF